MDIHHDQSSTVISIIAGVVYAVGKSIAEIPVFTWESVIPTVMNACIAGLSSYVIVQVAKWVHKKLIILWEQF